MDPETGSSSVGITYTDAVCAGLLQGINWSAGLAGFRAPVVTLPVNCIRHFFHVQRGRRGWAVHGGGQGGCCGNGGSCTEDDLDRGVQD
jgi:hypothetical protein